MSSPSTVLVLSTDPLIEMVVRHLLPIEQYAVRRIADRGEVLSLLEQEARLAILDLPEMDAETLAFVRDLHTRAGKPLLVLMTDPSQIAGQLEPAVRLLDRPPQLEQLQAALNAALAEPTPPTLPSPPPTGRVRRRLVSLVGAVVLAVAAAVLIGPMLGVPGMPNLIERFLKKDDTSERPSSESVTLLSGRTDAFELPDDVVATMKIPKAHRIEKSARPRTQTFSGTLAFDPDRLVRIQSLFPGKIVALGAVDGKPIDETKPASLRGTLLANGNRVDVDHPLAVVWCSTLGDRKSDLVDALSQNSLDTENLKYIEANPNIAPVTLRAAERMQQNSRIAVEKAERALLSWSVSDKEMAEIRAEAARIIERKGKRDPDAERIRQKNWARVEIHSPIKGVVVEKNVVPGNIIDSTQDLFKIADLTSLAVYVHVYEDDLPELQKLQKRYEPGLIPWRLYSTLDTPKRPIASPGIKRLSPIVDPNQHTSIAVGFADNRDRRLSVGQFVTAEVDIPPPPDVVSIPVGALDEDGETSHVLVQLDPDHHRYALRRVRVLQRFLDFAYVSSKLSDSDRASGLTELKPGELIITGGAVQLKPALEEAQARAKAQAKAKK